MRILAIVVLCCSFAINVSYAQSYDDSPSNFNNSPVNFKNSPSNWENSPANYENSPSNFKNSPANFENSPVNFKNSPTNFDNSAANYNRQKATYDYNSSLSRETITRRNRRQKVYNNTGNRTRDMGYPSPRPGRDVYRYDENGNQEAYPSE